MNRRTERFDGEGSKHILGQAEADALAGDG